MNFETKLAGETLPPDALSPSSFWRRRAWLLALLAALLIVAGWVMWSRAHKPVDAANEQHNVPHVTVIAVTPTAVPVILSGTGSLAARRDMPVSALGEGGRVTEVLVEPGTWVRAGQVLARMERSVQTQQAAGLAAQVEVARADAKLAEANLRRAQGLVAGGFVSRADLDSRSANRDAALARLNVAVAQLNQARATMARLDVRAPAAGLVLTRTVEPGQVVTGGSGVLFRIARDGELEMKLALNEADLVGLRVGSRAEVTPVGAQRPVVGQVWQVSPVVDPQTRQGSVRILLRYDPALRPGAFAQARVDAGAQTGFALPESAIQNDTSGAFVYVVDRNDRVRRRPVQTGVVTDHGVSVTAGLNTGDRVVSTAGGFLNPGDQVKPVPASAAR